MWVRTVSLCCHLGKVSLSPGTGKAKYSLLTFICKSLQPIAKSTLFIVYPCPSLIQPCESSWEHTSVNEPMYDSLYQRLRGPLLAEWFIVIHSLQSSLHSHRLPWQIRCLKGWPFLSSGKNSLCVSMGSGLHYQHQYVTSPSGQPGACLLYMPLHWIARFVSYSPFLGLPEGALWLRWLCILFNATE